MQDHIRIYYFYINCFLKKEVLKNGMNTPTLL